MPPKLMDGGDEPGPVVVGLLAAEHVQPEPGQETGM
jgi:hypothetical protein